jgi:hypothetical protein
LEAKATMSLAKAKADIAVSETDNVVQNLFVQESTLVASAQFKDAVRETFVEGPQKLRAILPFGFMLPPLPFEDQVSPFVQETEKKAKAQDLVNAVVKLLSQRSEEEFVKSLTKMDAEEVAFSHARAARKSTAIHSEAGTVRGGAISCRHCWSLPAKALTGRWWSWQSNDMIDDGLLP